MLRLSTATLFVLLSLFWSVLAQLDFENEGIIRSVELGGSQTYVSTTYAVKALSSGLSKYAVSISEEEHEVTSWVQAKLKGKTELLPIERQGHSASSKTYTFVVTLPTSLKEGDTANLVFETVQTHAAHPWPATASQMEGQSLKYSVDLFVISPYFTKVQRTKLRGGSTIRSHTSPENLEEFTLEEHVTKSGTTVTYGPFNNVPSSANAEFQETTQQRVTLLYDFGEPVLTVTTLRRSAEISHWGSNLNIQDDISLRNDGPTLKGQFARIDYQKQLHSKTVTPQTVQNLNLHLPPGIHNPYFYDLNGNVSTSRFRPSPLRTTTKSKSRSVQYSVLELRPRYPIMGGWNYTFTLGWDAPLADSARWDAKEERYIVGVPFWTPIPGAVVDDAETSIILPEGATDVLINFPFPPLAVTRGTHITYLDTIGRPQVVLHAKQVTERHTGMIYVSYKLPTSAHFRKPLAIALGTFGLFVLNALGRRVNTEIHK